jgi:hypothetical protein
MTLEETMTTLRKAGKEQTRKTYLRHGAGENVFGVSFADYGTLQKKIKRDHAPGAATVGHRQRGRALAGADDCRPDAGDRERTGRLGGIVRILLRILTARNFTKRQAADSPARMIGARRLSRPARVNWLRDGIGMRVWVIDCLRVRTLAPRHGRESPSHSWSGSG